jgi:hypothetical protein
VRHDLGKHAGDRMGFDLGECVRKGPRGMSWGSAPGGTREARPAEARLEDLVRHGLGECVGKVS